MSAQYSTDTVRGTQTAATTVWLATSFLFYISAFLAMTRLCQTLSNHYYGKWFYALLNQTLPYRLLYIVQPGVFTHDCSVLLTVPPPPPANIYIHKWRPRGKKEREGLLQGHSFKILFSDYYLTQQHFKSDYCTVYHIPLYFLTIGWILHVIQYIYVSH